MSLNLATEGRYLTKQEMVIQTLRNAILRGDLKPGQRLVIDEIAQQLNISHIPVREALQVLQSDGFVETIPHTGVRVTSITRATVREVFTVMEALEQAASRAISSQITAEQADDLQQQLATMDRAVQSHDLEHWTKLNTQFHQSLASLTGMPLLIEMTERVLRQWERVRLYFFSEVTSQRIERAQREHHAIVAAMQAHNAAEVERLVGEHNRAALEAYFSFLDLQDQAKQVEA